MGISMWRAVGLWRACVRVALVMVGLGLVTPARADQADDQYQIAQSAVCKATADVATLSPRPWAPTYEQFRLTAIATLADAETQLEAAGDELDDACYWFAVYEKYTKLGNYFQASAAATKYQIAWQSSIDHSKAAQQRAWGASACVRQALAAIGQ